MPAEPWDRNTALEQTGGDRELLNELIQLFLDDSDQLMQRLRVAVANEDARQVEHVAHTLKGSAMNFAAGGTRDLAFALEQMGRAGQLNGAAAVLDQLETEYGKLSSAMRSE